MNYLKPYSPYTTIHSYIGHYSKRSQTSITGKTRIKKGYHIQPDCLHLQTPIRSKLRPLSLCSYIFKYNHKGNLGQGSSFGN